MTDQMRIVPLFLSSIILAGILAGCAVGPDFEHPPAPSGDALGAPPTATPSADGVAQRFDADPAIPAEWWRLFGSEELDRLVQEALRENPTAQAAEANLRVAEDNLKAGSGVFYPALDAGFNATRQRFSTARFGGTSASIFNLFTLSTTVTYALDVFGGQRRQVEALSATADAQKAALQGSWLTLTGNVVNTILARAGYEAEIEARKAVIALEKEQVSATEAQVRAGTAPYSALLSLQSQLAGAEAALPPIEQAADRARHLLAQLSGHTPGEAAPPSIGLQALTLPAGLPAGLPSELVRRRPDILAAEGRLHAASAQIGVATAALFPSVTLTAGFGVNATKTKNLLSQSSSFWSFGPEITAPIFHGFTLEAERQAAIDAHAAAQAQYRETVLEAFTQVADTLRALEHDAEALGAQVLAQAAAKEALDLIQANYAAGIATYVQVELADTQYQQTRIGYIEALAQRFQDTVALYVALGGGWS